jgi:hypothetical protein
MGTFMIVEGGHQPVYHVCEPFSLCGYNKRLSEENWLWLCDGLAFCFSFN